MIAMRAGDAGAALGALETLRKRFPEEPVYCDRIAGLLERLGRAEDAVGHFQDLLERQQEDGGWEPAWEPPGPAAHCEWRARLTLDALGALAAYGVIPGRV